MGMVSCSHILHLLALCTSLAFSMAKVTPVNKVTAIDNVNGVQITAGGKGEFLLLKSYTPGGLLSNPSVFTDFHLRSER